ncbi:DNA-methyltransferase [Macrococcus animalis]|uniref:DNA-methyltransferase n=1 Tax=Macrococcus animalis TaxID=3395467 RepID=UPI0039BEC872
MIEIYNDDCLNKMATIEGGTVDLILTDPPYNLGKFMNNRQTNLSKMRENFFGSSGWDDLEFEEWLNLMEKFISESSRILKKGGAIIIFMSILKVESVVALSEKYGFYYKTTGIWNKTNPMPRNMNLHFVNSNECWIYLIKDKKTGKFNNKKLELDFIQTSSTPLYEKKFGKHPTQKPVKLFEHFISLLTDEDDLVLDPFMGSGTSAIAARNLKRNFIGIELNSTYYNIALRRIEFEI